MRVDVLPVAVSGGPEVAIDQLEAPTAVGAGSHAQVVVILRSTVATAGQLRIDVDGADRALRNRQATPSTVAGHNFRNPTAMTLPSCMTTMAP